MAGEAEQHIIPEQTKLADLLLDLRKQLKVIVLQCEKG